MFREINENNSIYGTLKIHVPSLFVSFFPLLFLIMYSLLYKFLKTKVKYVYIDQTRQNKTKYLNTYSSNIYPHVIKTQNLQPQLQWNISMTWETN